MTFTKSPYGPIARPTVTDAQQPNSPAQQAAKARLTLVAGFWRALGTAEKLAWSEAAASDRRVATDSKKSYRPTGYGLYSSLANVWLNARHNGSGTPPATPPSGELAAPALSVSAEASAGSVTFYGSADTPAGLHGAVRAPGPGGGGAQAREGRVPRGGLRALHERRGRGVRGAGRGRTRRGTPRSSSRPGRRTSFAEIPVTGVALALEIGGAAEKAPASAKRKAA